MLRPRDTVESIMDNYRVRESADANALVEDLNKHDAREWELVNVVAQAGTFYAFLRRREPNTPGGMKQVKLTR